MSLQTILLDLAMMAKGQFSPTAYYLVLNRDMAINICKRFLIKTICHIYICIAILGELYTIVGLIAQCRTV